MVKKKVQDLKSMGGPSEKKNEEATINMVMVITTKNKALEEVAFQEKEPSSKGGNPKIGKRRKI